MLLCKFSNNVATDFEGIKKIKVTLGKFIKLLEHLVDKAHVINSNIWSVNVFRNSNAIEWVFYFEIYPFVKNTITDLTNYYSGKSYERTKIDYDGYKTETEYY